MERWSVEHRVFCVNKFIQFTSVVVVQRQFRRHFNIRHCPQRKTIMSWYRKWEELGSILDKKSSGRPRSACNDRNQERVRAAVTASPTRCIVHHAEALHLTDRSMRRMLKKMKFHPYKFAVVQELSAQDKINRLQFCRNFMNLRENHQGIEYYLYMSDEAHFYLNGDVNKQNCRYWAEDNPREIHQRPLHSPKVTAWCAISSSKIVGPYFFEENGATVTVTAQRYAEMLQMFFFPAIHNELREYWFQQNGATSHTARISMAIL